MTEYLIKRLKETSTWLGIMQLLMAFGLVTITPEQNAAITAIIAAIAGSGIAGMATPDKQHIDQP